MLASYDVRLNGERYRLISDNGLQLGASLTEPATPGAMGTAIVGSTHGGIGREIDDAIGRYAKSVGFNTTIPGLLMPESEPVEVDDFEPTSLGTMRPNVIYQTGSKAFIVAGQSIYRFDPSATNPSLTELTLDTGSWGGSDQFSGSGFLFNGQMIFGIVNSDGVATQHASASATGADNNYDLDTTEATRVAFGASARGKAFWVNGDNKLTWAIQSSGTAFESATMRGPQTINDAPPRISWVSMIGSAVMLFTDGGEILGADETALWTLAGTTGNSPSDMNFGHGASFWQDVLLIPSQTGLWTFSGQNLLTRAVGGNYIQTTNVERFRGEVLCAAGCGPYAFFSLTDGDGSSQTYRLVKYAESNAAHDFLENEGADKLTVGMLPYYVASDHSTRLYYLVLEDGTDLHLWYRDLRLPTDANAPADEELVNPCTLDLLKMRGTDASQSMTKVWLQVRGHWNKGSGDAALSFENMTVDGNSVTIADVDDDGDFAIPIEGEAAQIGRSLTGQIKVTDPSYDTVVNFPLIFDYVWEPSTEDRVTVKVLAGEAVMGNRGGAWQDSAREVRDRLIALRSTVATLSFGDDAHGLTPWNVFVEDVQTQELPGMGDAGELDRVVVLQLRRL